MKDAPWVRVFDVDDDGIPFDGPLDGGEDEGVVLRTFAPRVLDNVARAMR